MARWSTRSIAIYMANAVVDIQAKDLGKSFIESATEMYYNWTL